ncbi:MAG: four helix bundle protein [Verrucomicrobiota bacterium]
MPFSHDNFIAHQKAIKFIERCHPVLEQIPAKYAARDQLDRASTSIALNIAEGNARFSKNDRARFFQFAHGSTVECAACLDVLVAPKIITENATTDLKSLLLEISKILLKLLDQLDCRISEESDFSYKAPANKF